ncbi:hypothetical protein D8Y20_05030 [Mariprofundus sp. EBB-1]|uniref:hypothetical protein n=1 Tax=Mariprofundus sp. EBB-1 TaxID=2650971 RepID=UPI000EF1D0F3|nr:hypothetical protein [Mariprofundus sp. EBB-1]RLL53537.1 hypothetical protein D8Y20_05030 [Mariprofundus sp. EBB-1]
MAHLITWEDNGLYRKFTGEISANECMQVKLELSADLRFGQIKYIINDYSGISGHSIKVEHARAFAKVNAMMANTKHQLKVALVVPHDSLLHFAQHYCALMQDQVFECACFHCVEDARQWIEA